MTGSFKITNCDLERSEAIGLSCSRPAALNRLRSQIATLDGPSGSPDVRFEVAACNISPPRSNPDLYRNLRHQLRSLV